jgi:ribose/xylose/arabinose/galactoside ABC-type transport system permease subunit
MPTVGGEMTHRVRAVILQYPALILLALLLLAAAVVTPAVLTPSNILLTLRENSVMGLMALGVTFVVLCGRIDVSIGSQLSFLVVVIIALHDIVGPALAIAAGFGIAVVIGTINGYLVAYLRLNSLVTTLGMLAALQGAANVANMNGINHVGRPELTWFGVIGRSYFADIPTPVWIFAIVAILAAFVLERTNFGRSVRAVGGNELASVYSSINARAIIFFTYLIAALLTALAAVIYSSRAMSAQSNSGTGMEITVLSSIFLGGTSLVGGIGGMGRTLLGVLVLAFIANVMVLVGMPPLAQWVVSASIIIIAVWFDTAGRRGTMLA